MIFSSVNLNKRLSKKENRVRLERWLISNNVDVLLSQEVHRENWSGSLSFDRYIKIDGDSDISTFIRDGLEKPNVYRTSKEIQKVSFKCWHIYNCYLPAYDAEPRVEVLDTLQSELKSVWKHPIAVVGDFNLAPTAEDGRYKESISDFTTEKERRKFRALLRRASLIDTTRPETGERTEFTIEQKVGGGLSRFRCDLALVSKVSRTDVSVQYDHSVRKSTGENFTDHSAIILNIPETIPTHQPQTPSLFDDLEESDSGFEYRPQNTAINRGGPSPIARRILEQSLINPGDSRLLDYGCGRGDDVRFFTERGFDVSGWDPHDDFGFTDTPEGLYDLSMCTFVLNVLPTLCERMEVLHRLKELTRSGGFVVTTTRSPVAIDRHAEERDWEQHNDGYWSSKSRKTFQKGIGREKHRRMWSRLGFSLHPLTDDLDTVDNASVSVVRI
jgi:exonuclease III